MNLLNFLIKFSMATFALLWMHLWKWCYPNSSDVINELARSEIHIADRLVPFPKLLDFCFRLPSIARSQQITESLPATQTRGAVVVIESRWKGNLREWLIWTVITGWIVMAISITTSFVQTGHFLFEYGPDSGRPELVTPYFKVVALALMAQFASVGSGLAVLRIRK